jgi:hypothetical protein
MSSYQRYLRERKEVQTKEQELDEASRWKKELAAGNLSTGNATTLRKAQKGGELKNFVEPTPSIAQRLDKVTSPSTKPTTKEKPGFSTTADPETMAKTKFPDQQQNKTKSDDSHAPSGKPKVDDKTKPDDQFATTSQPTVDASRISGQSLKSLLQSAGMKGSASMVAYESVKNALMSALRKNSLEIDHSFLG